MKLNHCMLGDCRDSMRQMLTEGGGGSVQTIVTSPPYFGLRDYGVEGQLGLEDSPQEFIANMVGVFDLCRELLADDGTLWLNMGDSYAGSWGAQGRTQGNGQMTGRSVTSARQIEAHPRFGRNTGTVGKEWGLKPKDKMLIPHRLAIALCDAGWYVRDDIVWAKPNPMPESVRDRCTKAHEYIFLLSKSERYFFDQEAILEPCSPNTNARLSQDVQNQIGSDRANGGAKTNGNMKAVTRRVKHGKSDSAVLYDGESVLLHGESFGLPEALKTRKLAKDSSGTKNNESFDAAMAIMPTMRNKRSVWTIATESYSEAHFATFPQALVEPCILAGSKPGDIVFDPFLGSGTTAQVAQQLGRKWVGCELNSEYLELQNARTRQQGLELTA